MPRTILLKTDDFLCTRIVHRGSGQFPGAVQKTFISHKTIPIRRVHLHQIFLIREAHQIQPRRIHACELFLMFSMLLSFSARQSARYFSFTVGARPRQFPLPSRPHNGRLAILVDLQGPLSRNSSARRTRESVSPEQTRQYGKSLPPPQSARVRGDSFPGCDSAAPPIDHEIRRSVKKIRSIGSSGLQYSVTGHIHA